VIGARLLHTLAGGDATALFGGERASALWGDTQIVLPEGGPDGWVDVLTGQAHGGELRLAGVLSELPVAVLVPAADWPALRDDGAAQTTAS
jgi:maltooligosyltrehalose synthase